MSEGRKVHLEHIASLSRFKGLHHNEYITLGKQTKGRIRVSWSGVGMLTCPAVEGEIVSL